MRTKAAVLYQPGTDFVVEEIELDPPQYGEVLVQFVATGICHSDVHVMTGDMALEPEVLAERGWQQFPIILGHEGAGVVAQVGPGVTDLAVGDHVVTSFVPSCGQCPPCSSGHQNLCDLGALVLSGKQADGTSRHHNRAGEDIAIMCCLGAFAEHSVVSRNSLVKIDADIPLQAACLVACGVTTGWGSSTYAAGVVPGETVVVLGAGGVGMSAIQAAAQAGAKYVVAVDPVPFKRGQAFRFGATHACASTDEASQLLDDLTRGRKAEKVLVTVGEGHGKELASFMALVAKNGTLVYTAAASRHETEVSLSLLDLAMQQKKLVGAVFGGANPRFDIPRLLGLYQAGRLKLDELITRTYRLDQINEGYADLLSGELIRGVVVMGG